MTTANELCDRVAFVVDGKIAAMDTPAELKIARDNGRCGSSTAANTAASTRPSFRWTA